MGDGSNMYSYFGMCENQTESMILFEAAKEGLISTVNERLTDKQRREISSGAVYVWDERKSGIKRWTDGISWSNSRVVGPFLEYRQTEPDTSGGGGFKIKAYGLRKRTLCLSWGPDDVKLHLIGYYTKHDARAGSLPLPSADPRLASITEKIRSGGGIKLNRERIVHPPLPGTSVAMAVQQQPPFVVSPPTEYPTQPVRMSPNNAMTSNGGVPTLPIPTPSPIMSPGQVPQAQVAGLAPGLQGSHHISMPAHNVHPQPVNITGFTRGIPTPMSPISPPSSAPPQPTVVSSPVSAGQQPASMATRMSWAGLPQLLPSPVEHRDSRGPEDKRALGLLDRMAFSGASKETHCLG